MTTANLFATHADRIEEVINKNIDVMLPGVDPIWESMVTTSQGVGPADALGKDFKILRVFQTGMTGILESGKPLDDFGLRGDDATELGARLYRQTLSQTFPDATGGPNQNPYRLGIPMRSMVSNIMFTLGELQAEATPSFIGQIIAPKLEGFARNIAQTLCNTWYQNQNENLRLAAVGSVVTTSANVDNIYRVVITIDNDAIDRFYVGQRLLILEDIATGDITSGDNQGLLVKNQDSSANIKDVFVERIDELTGEIALISEGDVFSGNSGSGEATAVGDQLLPAGSCSFVTTGAAKSPASKKAVQSTENGTVATAAANLSGIAGVNHWLKVTGNLLGTDADSSNAVSVTDHPEHRSFKYSNSSALLTEHTLRQLLRRFHAAKRKYGYYIDTLVASDGVWLGYESTKIGREMIDRTGRLSSLGTQGSEGGENFDSGFSFTCDGKTYKGHTSTYVEGNTLYGLRLGGQNWKKYVPPEYSGLSNMDGAPGYAPFKFVAGALTGTSTSQLPIYDSSASGNRNLVTEGSQMPGMLRMQVVPDQFCMMKITDIAEDRIKMATDIAN
jgi:hypothetical protein